MLVSRLIIFAYILLFIPGVISQETNCGDVRNPQSASECKLSTEDKETYEYCCYIKYTSYDSGECKPFTLEDYKDKGMSSKYKSFECEHAYSGCNDIKPGKASDCVLSQEDKDRNMAYCCYEGFEGDISCEAYNKEDYQDELEAYKIVKALDHNAVFDCGNGKSSSRFINISKIFFILFFVII